MTPTNHVDQAGRAYAVYSEAVAGDRGRAEQLAREARYGAWDPAVDAIFELLCELEATARERDVYAGLLDLKAAQTGITWRSRWKRLTSRRSTRPIAPPQGRPASVEIQSALCRSGYRKKPQSRSANPTKP
jgi:hypothetical protein